MSKCPELLAPAGDFEALKAAVQNGANAVYLAGKHFGARRYARNFSDEELVEAIKYCHVRDVAVYVTVNTLVLNHEFDLLKKYLDFLYVNDVDALLVQDMGVLSYIRQNYPDLDIHASTQMSAQTVEDVKFLASLGVKRVVLGREMSLDDIRRAGEETGVELEVFVHGALCISVSGQCLMSSMIGGRSGNRGSCAQPCRQKYMLHDATNKEHYRAEEGDYLLSTRDLCTWEDLQDLLAAGASSLKTEGRMKSAEYVAAVVGAYRAMLDEILSGGPPADRKALEKCLRVFNRGFTRGHYFGEKGDKLMGMAGPGNRGYYLGRVKEYDKKAGKLTLVLAEDLRKNDEIQVRRRDASVGGRVERLEDISGAAVSECRKGQVCRVNFKHFCRPREAVYKTYDEELMKSLRQTFQKERLEIPVHFKAVVKKDKKVECTVSDGKNVVAETGMIPEAARLKAITREEIKERLARLGDTPYRAETVEVELDDGLSVPAREINRLRRTLVEKLSEKRAKRYHRSSRLLAKEPAGEREQPDTGGPTAPMLTFAASNLWQLEKLLELGAQVIYYKDPETLPQAVKLAEKRGFAGRIIPEISRLAADEDLIELRNMVEALGLDTVLIQGHGQIRVFEGLNLVGDFNLNVVNDNSLRFFLERGFVRVTLSPELNLSQIGELNLVPATTEIIAFGHLPLMAMKHCVISAVFKRPPGCGLCRKSSFYLADKMKEKFPVQRKWRCSTEIYNSKKLLLLDYLGRLSRLGVGYFRLNFLNETPEEVETVVEIYRRAITSGLDKTDRAKVERLRESGVTAGHLHRGVE